MPKPAKTKNWGFDVSDIDKSVNPADDFFRFANGKWLNRNKIPADESRWGSFNILAKESREALCEILAEASRAKAKHGTNLQKVRDYYLSVIDMKRRNRDGAKPLKAYFDRIDGAATAQDFVRLSAEFRAQGISSLWRIDADQDMKNRNVVRLYIGQGGLGLPDRDYYLKMDGHSVEIRRKYLEHMKKMFALAGFPHASIAKRVSAVMDIETALARPSMTAVELRDLEKQYNKMRIAGLELLAPSVNWKNYFASAGADAGGELIVAQPKFIKAAGKLLYSVSPEDWRDYMRWKVTAELSGLLSDKLRKERFNFYGKVLSGLKKMKPLKEQAAIATDWALGEALGELYVKKHFRPQAKKEINELVDNLISAYGERIKNLDWMGSATKKKALEKLKAFTRKLGYPDKWRDYSKLEIAKGTYLENYISAYKFEFRREMKKIGRKPDRKEWGMTPPTVNAYNNFLFNEIVFPAGIMQPPFFDPDADDAVNYGGIGAVIGHELTHGFDDMGAKFNKTGEMKNWWGGKDKRRFDAKAKKLIKQYDKFEVLPGVFINGKLTIGENIADLGGLVIAYYAFQKALEGKERRTIDGFTPEQRFFLGAAQAERGSAREAEIRRLINTDPHSPSKARVNVPFSNMTEFYDAFGVQKGHIMWRPKGERVVIW